MITRKEIVENPPEYIKINPNSKVFIEVTRDSKEKINEDHLFKVTDIIYLPGPDLDSDQSLQVLTPSGGTWWVWNKHVILSWQDIDDSCKHEFIPLFNSVCCKHCGKEEL